jgi:ATP-dependent DNA helicase RecQ
VWLRRDAEVENRKVSKAGRSANAKAAYDGLADDPLWLALKVKRLELAREQAVPPYVIFHDTTLIEILNRRPNSLVEMSQIMGVGRAKLDRYGEDFLEVLMEHT